MQTIKYALIFGAGVASGVAGSYVYFKKKFNDITEMEIASVKAVYAKEAVNADISGDDDSEEELKKTTSGRYPWGPEKPDNVDEEKTGEAAVERILTNYSTISNGGYSERTIMNEKRKQELAEAEFPRDDTPSEVVHITGDQFVSEERYFDKKTLFYYEADETLADDVGNILEYSIVGSENVVEFAEGEDSAAYFRDYNAGTDYELVREDCSYNEALGLSDEY